MTNSNVSGKPGLVHFINKPEPINWSEIPRPPLTPHALRAVLTEWPLLSAPMAEALTGASRAAVQRNLAWMEEKGLVREMTGQGRYRMWRVTS